MAEKFWPAWRIVVYNTCGSYGAGVRKNALPGFVFVYSVVDLITVLRQSGAGPVRVCFTPLRSGDKRKVFCDVCRLVCDFGDVVFAVEEIWNFQSPSWSPDELSEAILQWRHYGLCLMWNAQQPQLVDQTLRSMSTEVYVGKFEHRLDLKAVADCRLSDEAMAIVPALPPRRFIHKMESGKWRVE
jgi:hypothetical protein